MDSFAKGVLAVGISGVTCGGKSTTANKLKQLLDNYCSCHIIGQDDYYKDEEQISVDPKTGLLEWDVMEAFHMDKLSNDLDSLLAKFIERNGQGGKIQAVVIVEGILLFTNRYINKLFDKRYFFTLPYEVAQKRRITRVYEPPDVPDLFEYHVWPKYIEQRDFLRASGETMIEIDATQSLDEVFKAVKSDLKETFWPNEDIL